MAVRTQKAMAIFFHPRPRSRAYIGPPSIVPSLVFTRYFTASRPSEYFVAMPSTPVIQHHSTAPGPPKATAVATPTMLPVPMVAASDVAKAPNWLTSPSAPSSRVKERRMPFRIWRCGKRNRTVRYRCVPSSSTIIGQPHSCEAASEIMVLMDSIDYASAKRLPSSRITWSLEYSQWKSFCRRLR